jgi:DNA ligase-associated metallophosphoesterase
MTKLTVNKSLTVDIAGTSICLLPEKAIYWPEKNCLLMADLHLGKAGHFRKAGIPIPSTIHDTDLKKLANLIEKYSVEKVYLLGDLFHSNINVEWLNFKNWIKNYKSTQFVLIMGNHDILGPKEYEATNFKHINKDLLIEPFLLSHSPILQKNIPEGVFNLAGHIHPSIYIKGIGKQGLTLPCFYFSHNFGILPAFGAFTGTANINATEGSSIFVVAEDKVIPIKIKPRKKIERSKEI